MTLVKDILNSMKSEPLLWGYNVDLTPEQSSTFCINAYGLLVLNGEPAVVNIYVRTDSNYGLMGDPHMSVNVAGRSHFGSTMPTREFRTTLQEMLWQAMEEEARHE